MTKAEQSPLVQAYLEWQKFALAALKKAQGARINGITHNMLDRLEEDLEAGGDLLPRLRQIHPRLLSEFEAPKRYDSSYRHDFAEELTTLEAEIARLELEAEEDSDEQVQE